MKYSGIGSVILFAALMVVVASGSAAEELTIVGTGSGSAILEAIGTAFHQQHPEFSVTVPKSIGSGGGIKAVGKDKAVLGGIARNIKENERSYGLTLLPIVKMPVVFYVNRSVAVPDLSVQQILDIYSGAITNWNEVGGGDARIRVIRREDGDSSHTVLQQSFPGFRELTLTSKSKTTFSDPETEELLVKTPGAIAYGPYSNARRLDAQVLAIDGTQASDETYPYVGMLALIFKQKNYTGPVKGFVEFARSEAAHAAIEEAGGIPYQE